MSGACGSGCGVVGVGLALAQAKKTGKETLMLAGDAGVWGGDARWADDDARPAAMPWKMKRKTGLQYKMKEMNKASSRTSFAEE